MLRKLLFLLVVNLLATSVVFSQVTTSSITGTAKDATGQPLPGATVTAIHNPSGTTYTTVAGSSGGFNLLNMRIGGPYTIRVTFSGQQPFVVEGVNLELGQPYSVNAVLGQSAALETIVVSGRGRRAAQDRTGAATVIGTRQLTTLPTISRSITDFTRLTPQANGNNFGGRDARYNNIQVDGANLNNNFGLSNDPLPGGGNQPISIDAYDQISVNIAPYDVRQAGFTGAGINAVTKSGTNTFRGSLYTLYRDQSFAGTNVAGNKLSAQQNRTNKTFGLTLGGPIIRNKLFFFTSLEKQDEIFPGITWSPRGGSGTGNVSSIHIDTLRRLSNFLRERYQYETGAFDNFGNFSSKNTKALAKIDYNISNAHRLTVKYNQLISENDVAVNSTSTPNGAYTGLQGRFSANGMSFENSNYAFRDVVRSGVVELNSSFNNKFSNQFIATITKIKATRTSKSELFPFIDILNANGPNTSANISAGFEPFSNNNDVINDVYSVINNFTYLTGKHNFTAGVSYEYQRIGNMFMPGSQSYYVFNSLQDFITNQAPIRYSNTYSLVPGKEAVYSAELKIGQLGLYLQDEINFSSKFKLTAGIRFDRPNYLENPIENPAISALSLYNKDGQLTTYKNSLWPKSKIYISPRIGFRYDPQGDKSLIIRGGSGLFTGRIPFVWLTNIPSNSGMYTFGAIVNNTTQLQNYLFNPNPAFHRDKLPTVAGQSVPGNIVLADPEFKFPQVFRSDIAVDKNLGAGFTLTLEALYTRDLNAVIMRNANQRPTNGTLAGPDNRPRFINTADRRLNSNITGSAVVLENVDKGRSFNFTAQLSKAFARGFYGSIAYNYSFATDVTPNPGSTANSVWNSNPAVGTQNSIEEYYSQYAVPHRIISNLSYNFQWLKSLGTTFSLVYEGSSQGNLTYVVGGDLNNDGNSNTDLLYIPRDRNEINFVATTTIGGVNYTAEQQKDLFFAFIEQDDYLRTHKGQYAERNGAKLPWYNRVDFTLLQDITRNIGKNRNTLQFRADVTNFLNLINPNLGVRQLTNTTQPIVFSSYNAAGQPVYRLQAVNNEPIRTTFRDNIGTTSTWGLQLGLRYIFN